MYDFTHDQLKAILELQPEGSSHELYREGFVEAQRAIYRELSGAAPVATEPQEATPAPDGSEAAGLARGPALIVGMRLRSRNTGRKDLQLLRVEGSRVLVGSVESSERWMLDRDSIWQYVEPIVASEVLLVSSLEIADELTRISKLIDELTVGYGNEGRSKEAAWSSKLFTALSARRRELRRALVALG